MIDIGHVAPASGRRATLVSALELLSQRVGPAHIVEVGTVRIGSLAALQSDGWSTRMFAWYTDATNGRFTTIDPNPDAQACIDTICGEWSPKVRLINERAEDVIGGLTDIDLLYMDGPADAEVHLAIYRALKCVPPLVLFDDILDDAFNVKGALAVPEMLEDGYQLVFRREWQALLAARTSTHGRAT